MLDRTLRGFVGRGINPYSSGVLTPIRAFARRGKSPEYPLSGPLPVVGKSPMRGAVRAIARRPPR